MKHAPQYLDTMWILAPLFRDVRKYSVWQFETLCDWMAYFWNRGTISFVIDEAGVAHGVCTIKLFSRLEQFLEPFVHEPQGQYCMIETLVADEPGIMGTMCSELVTRWGKPEVMLWDRGERTESRCPKIFRWNDFEKLARRLTRKKERIYGRRQRTSTS